MVDLSQGPYHTPVDSDENDGLESFREREKGQERRTVEEVLPPPVSDFPRSVPAPTDFSQGTPNVQSDI